MNFFKELITRLRLPTPEFFNKVFVFGVFLGGLGAGIAEVHAQFPDVAFIKALMPWTQTMMAVGATTALVSKLTAKPQAPNAALCDSKEE